MDNTVLDNVGVVSDFFLTPFGVPNTEKASAIWRVHHKKECLLLFSGDVVCNFHFNMLDRYIKRLYYAKGGAKIKLPAYISVGEYRLCIYAMNMDWDSLRIKIEKDFEVYYVIKKGRY